MILIGIGILGCIVVNILFIAGIIYLLIEGADGALIISLVTIGFVLLIDVILYQTGKTQIWQMINMLRG